MKSNTMYRRSVIAVIGVVLLILTATIASAKNLNPGVLPPNSHSFGMTYGEWSAAWWQWALSIPVDENPLLDPTGENCDVGQSGKVWFLAGTVGGSVERECTVPVGKAIFFPIVNTECDDVAPFPPPFPQPPFLAECAQFFIDHATVVEVTVDGVPLQNVDMYRVQSPPPSFTIDLPDNNIFGVPGPVSGSAVSDGFWILLAPLSKGEHIIQFRGVLSFPEPELNFTFETEVTYHLTVAPRKP